MTCQPVSIPGGGTAIVCGGRGRDRCGVCGKSADRLCDWKVPRRSSGTCDKPICSRCSVSPAPDKDLCPAHATEFEAWRERRV